MTSGRKGTLASLFFTARAGPIDGAACPRSFQRYLASDRKALEKCRTSDHRAIASGKPAAGNARRVNGGTCDDQEGVGSGLYWPCEFDPCRRPASCNLLGQQAISTCTSLNFQVIAYRYLFEPADIAFSSDGRLAVDLDRHAGKPR